MTDDTALLTRALRALTYHREQTRPVGDTDEVIAALRSRLAEKPNGEIFDLKNPSAYYVSGPYESRDGAMSVCELATGRVVALFAPRLTSTTGD